MAFKAFRKTIFFSDVFLARLLLRLGYESNSLIILCFHTTFVSEEEKKDSLKVALSHDGITLDRLRNVISYFLASGYTFISPENMCDGLRNNKKYAMLTFDDGYANNKITLPLLKHYNVPAVFFVSIGNVINNKCFWWDVVYREMLMRHSSLEDIRIEIQRLKNCKTEEIDEYIYTNYGTNAFKPVSELDRPFSVKELREFSAEPLVCVGNHTFDHSILTNYNESDIRVKVSRAQDALYDITRCSIPIISYPSGRYSSQVIDICREMNFLLGVTVKPTKTRLPISTASDKLLTLGRFSVSGNDSDVLHNCFLARYDFNCWTLSAVNFYNYSGRFIRRLRRLHRLKQTELLIVSNRHKMKLIPAGSIGNHPVLCQYYYETVNIY